MDDERRSAVELRARELWEAAGSPEGHELTYRYRAEQEGVEQPVALESASTLRSPDGIRPTDEPLRRAVDDAVPEAERLPTGADENPISQRVRDAADDPTPAANRSTVQGGDQV